MATTEKTLTAELFETTIKFRVNNVSALKTKFNGPSVRVSNATFTPALQVCENKEGRYSSLGYFLKCDWHDDVEPQQRSCKVKFQFVMHAQDRKSKDLTRHSSCTFNAKRASWGHPNFIPWFQLIQPAWRANDSISLEIKIEVEKSEIEEKNTELAPAQIEKENVQVATTVLEIKNVQVTSAELENGNVQVVPIELETEIGHVTPAKVEKENVRVAPAKVEKENVQVATTVLVKENVQVTSAELEKENVQVVPIELETENGHVSPAKVEQENVQVAPVKVENENVQVAPTKLETKNRHVAPAEVEKENVQVAPTEFGIENMHVALENIAMKNLQLYIMELYNIVPLGATELAKKDMQMQVDAKGLGKKRLSISVDNKMDTALFESVMTNTKFDWNRVLETCVAKNKNKFPPAAEVDDLSSDADFVLVNDA